MSVAYKKNGTEIPITSSIMGSVNNNYSTEERKIGTWIDGKPLYRKCVQFNSSALTSSETTLNHGIADVNVIVKADGIALKTNNGSSPLTTYHSASAWVCGVYNLSRTNFVFYVGASLKPFITSIVVAFEYTKTTD